MGGKVAAMVWAGGRSNYRGWGALLLWSSQRQNTNQGQVGPNWSVNLPVLHDKGAIGSAYPCCTELLPKVALPTQNLQANSEQAKLVGIQYWGYC